MFYELVNNQVGIKVPKLFQTRFKLFVKYVFNNQFFVKEIIIVKSVLFSELLTNQVGFEVSNLFKTG